MTRTLTHFTGKCLILGGGWKMENSDFVLPKTYLDKDTFYTVDIRPDKEPDAIFNFLDREAWSAFPDSSFDFIIFEAVPALADIQIAFEECERILSNTGVVFYRGGCGSHESMLDLFLNANFKQAVLYIPPIIIPHIVEVYKMDKGMLSFASKNPSLLTEEYMQQHLPKEALEAIRFHISHFKIEMGKSSLKDVSLNKGKLYSKAFDSEIHFTDDFLEAPHKDKTKRVSCCPSNFWTQPEAQSNVKENVPKPQLCNIL